MTTLRVVVVEDQAPARDHLVDVVSSQPGVEIVAVCPDGPSAIAALRSTPADVVLLDIQMPECDGFQVIDAVGPTLMPPVVFITAYDDHAVRAFDVRALDYLVKPFAAVRVRRALDLAREHMRMQRVSAAAATLAGLAGPESGDVADPAAERLELRQRHQLDFVRPGDVELVVARRNDVVLHTRNAEFRVRATLSEMHKRLGETFVRVHRSRLVNMAAVRPSVLTRGGVVRLQLASGRDVRVAKACRADIERRLKTQGRTQ
jgi:two-component system LytT family response regulator